MLTKPKAEAWTGCAVLAEALEISGGKVSISAMNLIVWYSIMNFLGGHLDVDGLGTHIPRAVVPAETERTGIFRIHLYTFLFLQNFFCNQNIIYMQ